MEDCFSDVYDRELTCSIYIMYEEGDEVLDDLIRLLCPLVRMVFCIEIGSSFHHSQSYLEGDALTHVYFLVTEEILPMTPGAFTSYLYRSIKYSMLRNIRRLQPQVFEYWRVCDTPHYDANNRLAGYKYVEAKIFLVRYAR